VDEAKPFKIPKREVWEAFKRVKANQGAAGVDGQSIAEFDANLSGNLYKLWNRLSSGSYFPPPVRRVDIPKANGGNHCEVRDTRFQGRGPAARYDVRGPPLHDAPRAQRFKRPDQSVAVSGPSSVLHAPAQVAPERS